ncbi:MAG: hypothetical protein U0521_12620 [Anaerolineae bacterium]
MAYFLNLFSPETYETFLHSQRNVSGFRIRQENAAGKIHPGDKFICYLTKLSRWIAVFDVMGDYFVDETPIYYPENDPFIVRFEVVPIVCLEKELTIPIHEPFVWDVLSFTRSHPHNSYQWTGKVRASLNRLNDADGRFLEKIIRDQAAKGIVYPINEQEYARFATHSVRRQDKVVIATVPQNNEEDQLEATIPDEVRQSIKIQALIAEIGSKMGMKIWIPRNDKAAVLGEWKGDTQTILNTLPLNYDEITLKTIEQIDVLWLKGRSIIRAFEVEHTTSIYSGILRMADLLALQPNMDIKLHIVAPYERRDKVFQEIRRPVFSLLERAPLYELCTFISYDSLHDLANEKHLTHLSDSVLDDYAEEAE